MEMRATESGTAFLSIPFDAHAKASEPPSDGRGSFSGGRPLVRAPARLLQSPRRGRPPRGCGATALRRMGVACSARRVRLGGYAMEWSVGALAQTGDNYLPFIVGGVVVIALIVLVVAFILMRRK